MSDPNAEQVMAYLEKLKTSLAWLLLRDRLQET
jgi:hypothetical protein